MTAPSHPTSPSPAGPRPSPTAALALPSSTASPSAATSSRRAPTPTASTSAAPKWSEPAANHCGPALPTRLHSSTITVGLRREDIPFNGATSDTERVEPVRPAVDAQGTMASLVAASCSARAEREIRTTGWSSRLGNP
jgi:hypothetical protein